MDGSYTLMVLTQSGELYSVYLYPYDKEITEFVKEVNDNIKKYYNFNGIEDISVILTIHGNTWEDIYFTYTKDDEEMAIRSESLYDLEYYPDFSINKLSVNLGPVYIKYDNTVYDNNDNKLNIKPKYLLEYISETGHGAFLDE